MDAVWAHLPHRRGAPRLLQHFAALERLTAPGGPTGRLRLERELGRERAELLVAALARAGRPRAAFASV